MRTAVAVLGVPQSQRLSGIRIFFVLENLALRAGWSKNLWAKDGFGRDCPRTSKSRFLRNRASIDRKLVPDLFIKAERFLNPAFSITECGSVPRPEDNPLGHRSAAMGLSRRVVLLLYFLIACLNC